MSRATWGVILAACSVAGGARAIPLTYRYESDRTGIAATVLLDPNGGHLGATVLDYTVSDGQTTLTRANVGHEAELDEYHFTIDENGDLIHIWMDFWWHVYVADPITVGSLYWLRIYWAAPSYPIGPTDTSYSTYCTALYPPEVGGCAAAVAGPGGDGVGPTRVYRVAEPGVLWLLVAGAAAFGLGLLRRRRTS